MSRIKDNHQLDLTEDQLQAKVWKRLWKEYPHLRRRIWHVANQGAASQIRGVLLKAMGLLEGVWDLHMFYRNQYVIFEGKVGNNQLTKDRIDKRTGRKHFGQKEWGELMTQEGAWTYVFRTEEQFFEQLEEVLVRIESK